MCVEVDLDKPLLSRYELEPPDLAATRLAEDSDGGDHSY